MKKLIVLAASAAAFATPAMAGEAGPITYNLEASVPLMCNAYAGSATNSVNFGDLSEVLKSETREQSAGGLGIRCNSANGFNRTVASLNGGKLVRTGSDGNAYNSIAYEMSQGGGGHTSIPWTSLATPFSQDKSGSIWLAGQTGSIKFRVNGVNDPSTNNYEAPGTTVYAGTYTDTVTYTVTAL